jgi:hypothetical protein
MGARGSRVAARRRRAEVRDDDAQAVRRDPRSLHALAEHVLATTGDSFWNQPFGATVTWEDIRSVEDAVEFFRQGRQHAAG